MTRGGARNRSGPQKDPGSGRSDRAGFKLSALPAEGYGGEPPAFPLPPRTVYFTFKVDGGVVRQVDEDATERVAEREREVWAWAWSLPQACAWSLPSESWRLLTIAHWVRTSVICEGSDATAADKGSLHRFADQIGLTPAGLRENGWAVSPVSAVHDVEDAPVETGPAPVRRMRAVPGGA